MSRSEILYVKGMNISETEDDEVEEDLWDDRKLNDAYDKALRIANLEVAKRVAMSTNTKEKEATNKSKSKKNKSSRPSSTKGKKEEWVIGMPCRAVYELDGLEYEAVILRIINDNECIVKFLGYDNSEIVPLNSLKPTQGKDARAQQIEQALQEKADDILTSQSPNVEAMEFSDRAPSTGSTEKSFQKHKKSLKKKNKNAKSMPRGFEMPGMPFSMPDPSLLHNFGSMEMPMPLPPPPPMPLSERVDSEEQAVSSMLLSWYMSGYYTGLYQGLKRAKENRRN